ncbi:aldehyde dehydrogenase family protein, partial [Chitinimonas sp.]|uniref:aldehyde dehydrogenase family protein n=1 Tax=Chitinimonas sp. TaxID=1934313 RepID=UPI0035B4E38E
MTAVLDRIAALSGHNYLQGRHIASQGERAPIIDPATEAVIGHYALSSPEEVDTAIRHANAAQPGWWALSALERAEVLHEVARKLKQQAPAVAEALTREMGKPYRESLWECGDGAASSLAYYAELAR